MLLGYARVSTSQQSTDLQLDAFARAGVHVVYQEKLSANKRVRPELDRLLRDAYKGDVVVVYKVDRLARSIVDLRRILDQLADKGVGFRSLTQPLDTTTSMGRMFLSLLGLIAEFERDMILERCDAGRQAARERGVVFGRPPKLSREVMLSLRSDGLSDCRIAKKMGCSQSTVTRVLRGHRLCDRRPA